MCVLCGVFLGRQVLRHLRLENAQLPRLSFRHSFGVKIALKLHLLLALHLLKNHRSHTPVRAALVSGQGWLRLLAGSAGFTESQSDTDPIGSRGMTRKLLSWETQSNPICPRSFNLLTECQVWPASVKRK